MAMDSRTSSATTGGPTSLDRGLQPQETPTPHRRDTQRGFLAAARAIHNARWYDGGLLMSTANDVTVKKIEESFLDGGRRGGHELPQLHLRAGIGQENSQNTCPIFESLSALRPCRAGT